jgi:hypothetical protein
MSLIFLKEKVFTDVNKFTLYSTSCDSIVLIKLHFQYMDVTVDILFAS